MEHRRKIFLSFSDHFLSLFVGMTISAFACGLAAAEPNIERLATYLKGKKITVERLEKDYSCYPIAEAIERGIAKVKNLEKAVRESRENARIAGLFPKVSAWAKYRSDARLYLYQQNNISVGKDYITVGPDDNNTTVGDIHAFEIGGKIEFDLTQLAYNSDTVKFANEEQQVHQFRTELIEKMVYAYYFIAVVKALSFNETDVPPEIMIPAEIAAKKLSAWFYDLTGMRLDKCGPAMP